MIIWAIHESITDTISGSNSNNVKNKLADKNDVAPDVCNIAFGSFVTDTVPADPSTEDVSFFVELKESKSHLSFCSLRIFVCQIPQY